MKKIIITGGEGLLGTALGKTIFHSTGLSRNELDITNKKQVEKQLKKLKPDIIIHTAALTSIRISETNKKLAYKTNVEGTKNLIKACASIVPKCYFVYISTACVFDGVDGMYTENDLPYPKNYYSLTKYVAEEIIKSSNLKNWLIIRTNFIARQPWPYPKAFKDRYGTYLYSDDLASAISEIIKKKLTGIIHITGDKKLSMLKAASFTTPDIKSMTYKDYNGPPLTQDMSLDSLRLKKYKLKH